MMRSAPLQLVPARIDADLEVVDLRGNAAYAERPRRTRDPIQLAKAMHRISRAFVETPEIILQELVEVAVELCGADSAGISIEKEDATEDRFYYWPAAAGEYTDFTNAEMPRYPSGCGICLERDSPQMFRVGKRFFDILNISAPLVTDGILLPWRVNETRGTIFIMAHRRHEAFDQDDWQLMEVLADLAATGVRQQRQQRILVDQASSAAAVETANALAHLINNPLQSLTNILHLAAGGYYGDDAKKVGQETAAELEKLSMLVKALLELPLRAV